MLSLTLSTLRSRKSALSGAVIALFLAAAMTGACGILLQTGLSGAIPAQRYAGTPVIVAADQSAHRTELDKGEAKVKSKPLADHAWIPAVIGSRLRSLPGVRAVVPELQFPAYVVTDGRPVPGPGGAPSLGHAWTSAVLTPFTLSSGTAPRAPGDVVIDAGLARRLGLAVGSEVPIETAGLPTVYRVSGVTAQALSGQSAIFFFPGQAQRLAGHQSEVAAIGLLSRAGVSAPALAAEARAALAGTGAVVYTGDQRGPLEYPGAASARATLVSMAGAIGGTALLIAIGVVAGTFALSVRQRYREIALLRAVAATPRQARRMLSREALIAGLLAGTAGSAASPALASWLRERFVAAGVIPGVLHLSVSPYPMLIAVAATLAAAQIAAWMTGGAIIRIRPAQALTESAMEPPAASAARMLAGGGLLAAAIILTVVLSGLTTQAAATPVVLLTALMWVAATALLGPVIVAVAGRGLGAPFGAVSRASGYLAAASLRAGTRRYASAVLPVALMVTMTCVTLFSQSTVGNTALAQTRAATLAEYVMTAPAPGIPSAAAANLAAVPGVAGVTEVIHSSALGMTLAKYTVTGVTPQNLSPTLDVGLRSGTMNSLGGDTVAASGSTGLRLGETLWVYLGDGTPVSLRVAATYSRGLGLGDLIMPFSLVAAHADVPLASEVLVRASPGAGDLRSALTAHIGGIPGARLLGGSGIPAWQAAQQQSNDDIQYLAMGLIIAFTLIAAANTLIMAILDRRREFALLRMIGATRSQVRRLARWESLAVTLIAAAASTVISLLTLSAFAHGTTGSWTPSVPVMSYLAVIACAAAVTFLATETAARSALRAAPC
ncbi:MAG: ABC transporter permease [Streptosporangiales bacterium]|nr:ABC transporter permease [Streptosporangiales bacterium]